MHGGSAALQQEFLAYVRTIKERLSSLRRGSKQFWSLSKKLLLGCDKKINIPTLKDTSNNSWIRLPAEKAELFDIRTSIINIKILSDF